LQQKVSQRVFSSIDAATLEVHHTRCAGRRVRVASPARLVAMVWIQPTLVGPSPAGRGGCASAVCGNDLVFIGGADRSPKALDDVWVLRFEGRHPLTARWIRQTTTSRNGETFPAGRSGHSATTIGSEIYVFGGMDPVSGTCFNDVVVLSTQNWEWRRLALAETGSPPPRNAHVACAFRNDTCIVVHGGSSPDQGPMGDIHVLNVLEGREKWERPRVTGQAPDPREMHAGVCMDDELIICGGRGRDGVTLSDIVVLDLTEMRWVRKGLFPNGALCAHGAATWQTRSGQNACAIFGGVDGQTLRPNELTVFDCETLAKVALNEKALNPNPSVTLDDDKALNPNPKAPASRFAHACVSLRLAFAEDGGNGKTCQHAFVVFAGVTPAFDLRDVWVWVEDFGTREETPRVATPTVATPPVATPSTVPASDLD
jgi:hypothetical protein